MCYNTNMYNLVIYIINLIIASKVPPRGKSNKYKGVKKDAQRGL